MIFSLYNIYKSNIMKYNILLIFAFLAYVSSFQFRSTTNYIDDLDQTSSREKLKGRRNRKYDREWSPRRQSKSSIIHSNELGDELNFPHNKTEEDDHIQLSLPKKLFIPLSKMSPFLSNNSRNPWFQNSHSESNQFNLEDISDGYNFSKVGGYIDVKEELTQILDFIKEPDKYTKYGVRLVKGILLEGLPGNGKTLIAKCLAGQAKMNFVVCSGSEFMEKYVGVGASRVRELFKFVRQNQPCILFIDELDAIGKKRSEEGEVQHGERDQTLNQLLVLMDGFHNNPNENILIVGATNRLDMLDPAIIRPGRFDKIIHIPNPDADTRRNILRIHSEQKPLNVKIEHLVKMTNGFSGAQIENLLNEATLMAIRMNEIPVTLNHIEKTKERILVGQTSNYKSNMTDATLRRIAIHEVGHLLLALQSEHYPKPWKITIDSVNPKNALGYTIFENEDLDEGLFLREHLQDQIKVLLGGRVAEEVVYGHSVSSGALSDLEKAFGVARNMIMDYGMGNSIIYPYMSETYKKRIDEQIHLLIMQMHTKTKEYMLANRFLMDIFVEHLLEKRTLLLPEIEYIYNTYHNSHDKTSIFNNKNYSELYTTTV